MMIQFTKNGEQEFTNEINSCVKCQIVSVKVNYKHIISINKITLCRSCHDSIKDKEHFYSSLFMEIIRKNAN